MTSLAVIDSDTPAFASAISCEDYHYETPEGDCYRRKGDAPKSTHGSLIQVWEATAPPQFAVSRCEKFIQTIIEEAGCDDYVLFIGGDGNFRYDLPTPKGFPYKGNRAEMHTPFYLEECKNYLKECHPTVVCDGYEADDGCGILMSTGMEGYDELLLCHIDKDMDMIEGNHMRWSRNINGKVHPAEFYTISKEEANRHFYMQLLSGDSTDNIPGLYKLTGKKLLKPIREGLNSLHTSLEMWEYVKGVYAKNGMKDENILIQIARLLWIQREENEVWFPPVMGGMR